MTFPKYSFKAFETLDNLRDIVEILDTSNLDWMHNDLYFQHAIRIIDEDSYNTLMHLLPQTNFEIDYLQRLRREPPVFSLEQIKEYERKLDQGAAEGCDEELAYEYDAGREHLDFSIKSLQLVLANSHKSYMDRNRIASDKITQVR